MQGGALEIVRTSNVTGMVRQAAILVNGQKMGDVGNAGTQRFMLAPGHYQVEARIDWIKSKPFPIEILEGQVRRIEMTLTGPLQAVPAAFGVGEFFTFKDLGVVPAA